MAESKVASTIKHHPTIWFFVFAFAISWVLWFIEPLLPINMSLAIVAVFGPTVAAIIVAACMNSVPSHASTKKRVITFVVVFAVALASYLYAVNGSLSLGLVGYVISAFIVAYAFSSIYHPKLGVAQLFSGLKQKNKKTIWLLIALLLPFLFQLVGSFVDLGLGGNGLSSLSFTSLLSVLLFAPYMFFYGGPAAEEPGWRGFANAQMQKWSNPLVVGVLIGFLWAVWHLPLYFTGQYTGGLDAILFRFEFNVPLGVLFCWFYNKSGGNLLASILLHMSNNLFVNIFGAAVENYAVAVMIVFTVIAVFESKMWRKTDRLSTIQSSSTEADTAV